MRAILPMRSWIVEARCHRNAAPFVPDCLRCALRPTHSDNRLLPGQEQ